MRCGRFPGQLPVLIDCNSDESRIETKSEPLSLTRDCIVHPLDPRWLRPPVIHLRNFLRLA